MNKTTQACLLTALETFPLLIPAQLVLAGNTSSKISAYLKPNNLSVTYDRGRGGDQELEMLQTGGWDAPDGTAANCFVYGVFQMRLDAPLLIPNASHAARVSQRPQVDPGAEVEAHKHLTVGVGTEFKNPPRTVPCEDSAEYYGLTVSAYPSR